MTYVQNKVVWGSCCCRMQPPSYPPASPSLGKLLVVAQSSFSQVTALGEELMTTWYSQCIWYVLASLVRDRTKLCR